MKQFFYIFLYLNIYTSVYWLGHSQSLKLEVYAEKPISKNLKDSLLLKTTFKDYSSLKNEVDSLPILLRRMGYLESELKNLQKESDTLYKATYYFGKKLSYLKVFYSEEIFKRKQLERISSKVTDTYFILPFETAEKDLQKLNSLQTETGDAFASLSLKNLFLSNGFLEAELSVDARNTRKIDSIVVKGYDKFPTSYLRHYSGVRKGKPFNLKKIIKQNNALNSLGFVETIKPPEALFRRDKTVIYFYLKKKTNNLFDGILGFTTDEETQQLKLNGYLNLELNNNLNYGEQLTLNYKADGNEQINFDVAVTLPYLFKSSFGLGAGLRIFKRDSTFVTTEQQVRATYQINPSSTSYFGYKAYESSNLLDTTLIGNPIIDYTSSFVIAGINYRIPQSNTLFPIKTNIALGAELGKRNASESSLQQVRFNSEASTIFQLNSTNSIFVKNATSFLTSNSYITNELFRFGGINSIRGFNENSIDASLFSTLNTEYRFQFNESIYLHSIIDFGYFENEVIDLKQKIYSFGIGLGLKTKAGLFKFNFANGNTENQEFSFSNTKIHLSLSSKF
ncbi:POTRA domain-containing protein [Cochleicola gelatinilyticus]|uniref:POTRA domain-containing protein n=1 Tax=Cochleicola gelatinilyticus TaxID=1763537 RepID=A0A167IFV9_9FLAO|nr:POTRA domain-containing protein [Cochleicola gelatinilyticus]OAB79612.1 hypothetical protein ULVI_02330 [Cochleicola gelatinilyticus]